MRPTTLLLALIQPLNTKAGGLSVAGNDPPTPPMNLKDPTPDANPGHRNLLTLLLATPPDRSRTETRTKKKGDPTKCMCPAPLDI